MVKWSDEPRTESSGTEPTDASGDSAVSGRVCEQRYAAERGLQQSRFELQHVGSPPEEAEMEEEERKRSRGRPVDGGGIGQQDVGVGE